MKVGDVKNFLHDIEDNKEIQIGFDFHGKNSKPSFRFDNNKGHVKLRITGNFNKLLDISEEVLDNLIIGSYLPF